MGHITNWFKINYRGRALVACLIGLVILWSKVSLVTDVIYIVVFKDYSKLEKYGVEVTYAEEPEEEPIGITMENTDTIVIDNVVIDGSNWKGIDSRWYVIDSRQDTIVIKIRWWAQ